MSINKAYQLIIKSINVFIRISLFFILTFSHAHAATQATEIDPLAGIPLLSEITITGLDRTSTTVVEQELIFKKGETITLAAYEESIQRLQNLLIFSEITPSIELDNEGNAKFVSHFEEKWTVIPIAKIVSGGDARHITIGAYDINAFGKYKEVGAQYENYNGKHSAVLWYRNPRFFKKRLLFGIDGWTVRRPYTHYNPDASIDQAFVLDRKKLNTFIEWEFRPWLTLGSSLEFDRDELLDEVSNANILGITLSLGRLNYDNYLLSGNYLKIFMEQGLAVGQDAESFTRTSFDGQLFYRLPWHSNLAFHLRGGQTNSDATQHLCYVGGLENVRGYFDGQYRDKSFWQLNSEFRFPSYRSKWFVLQHTLFFDATQTADNLSNIIDTNIHTSYGMGIRLISPKVYRLTARLDYAITNSTTGASAISFGAQQFF